MSIRSRHSSRTAHDDVLARSMAFARVQRIGVGLLAVALLGCGPVIGWSFLTPLAGTLAALAVLKHPGVQRRFGVVTSWASWIVGLLGCAFIIGVSNGPIEYLLPAIAIPTILGSSIFPIRTVPLLAIATVAVATATVAVADRDALASRTAVIVTSVVILGAIILLTAIARSAESESYLESREDGLTGAFNRLALSEHLAEMHQGDGRWALILGDLDEFKLINDRYGHRVGDQALTAAADYLMSRLPAEGRLYRFGGEEFLISLTGEPALTAARFAEECRAGVATLDVDGVAITMSFGVATSPSADPTRYDALFAAADSALYEAKAAGRNAVRVARSITGAVDDRDPWQATDDLDRAGRRPIGLGGHRTPIINDEVEREQLVDVMLRQFRGTRITDLIMVFPLIVFHGHLGWLPLILALPTLVGFRYSQQHLPRMRTPEYLIAPVLLAAQMMLGAILIVGRGDGLWALSVFSVLMVASSAAFPWRIVRWAAAGSAAILVLTAIISGGQEALTQRPQAVASALGLLLSCTIVGREIGRRILGMRRASTHDALTGLPNRSAFERRAATAIDGARADAGHAALIIGDIDHFKQVNDRLGHHRGDLVLVAIASRLQSRLRQEGALFRIGGEEFAVVLPGLELKECADIAHRLRAVIAMGPVAGVDLTMSFGVAHGRGTTAGLPYLFAAADRALYRAKVGGRNRVVVAQTADFASAPETYVATDDGAHITPAAPHDPHRTG